ncbi:unnamed protein product [Pleuronectes platessa]|uniref:Uncharacterized protein n=1 Tax=Pleuronectes platessa TaxID=8262 RepID=A0A9N7Y7P2_PLEPL|nr:unnamed protein product [Pleuronectes platessa]
MALDQEERSQLGPKMLETCTQSAHTDCIIEPSRGPPDTGAERNKGLLNFRRENILLQAQESPPGGGKMFWECLGTPAEFQAQPTQDKASFCRRRDEAEFRSTSKTNSLHIRSQHEAAATDEPALSSSSHDFFT